MKIKRHNYHKLQNMETYLDESDINTNAPTFPYYYYYYYYYHHHYLLTHSMEQSP